MGYIYIILNIKNYKFYVGSTKNYKVRKLKHINELNKNKHHSIHLQRAWNKYTKNSFIFAIIETCYNYVEREQEILNIIDIKKDSYNVSSSASGGDLISNHPNKESIIAKATLNLKKAKKRGSIIGSKNPNWKGGKTFCKCGSRINSVSKTCIKCKDVSGNNNPFYGKKHSNKTKEKLSSLKKGVYKGNQEKPVIIENVEYKSVSLAAKILQVVPATILNRIKSKNIKYKNYKYKNESRANK